MTSSSSSSSDRATRSSRDEASRPDYAKLHDSRKRTRNSTRNSDDDSENSENIIESIIESINYSWNFILNSHVHMIRVLRALASENTLKLTRHSKSQSLKEAKTSSNWMHWKIAMTVKVEHLVKANTYELIKSSSNRKVIIDRWVFRLKSDVHDNIVRYKARWIVHEYKQQKEIDFTVIWAEVIKSASFRTLFAISAKRNLYIEQMNVVTAFLYEFLDEDIYVTQSKDFAVDSIYVCHLFRALYDLKQTSRVWYSLIRDFLKKKLNFINSDQDQSIFIFSDKQTYICVYVNDLLIFSENMKFIKTIKKYLMKRFEMIDLESVSHYLELSIERRSDQIILNQTIYLKKILKRFDMLDCASVSISMKSDTSNNLLFVVDQADEKALYWYESVIDSLMFAAIMTRSNIAYAMSIVSRYAESSESQHVKTINRILKYIKESLDLSIVYSRDSSRDDFRNDSLQDYCDSDHDEVIDDRRSITEWIFTLAEASIFWSSKRQDVMTLSFTETEYYALSKKKKEVIWLRKLLIELKKVVDETVVFIRIDNRDSQALTENSQFHQRTKHINIRYHWIKEMIENETISMKWVFIKSMLADKITKALFAMLFDLFVNFIEMIKMHRKDAWLNAWKHSKDGY